MDGVFPLSLKPARLLFICSFLGAHHIFLGQAWAAGKGKFATCRHRADHDLSRYLCMYSRSHASKD